ncbi:hypothetical protein BKA66DRAFT_444432 [Pyrenochaeta sp. MPI-SDFR-AT-0127]|nr:hypothetical protein BKA66DRAFT_444432 [Pyrenochaeta sp. MPI-SDFR-AT-0127]
MHLNMKHSSFLPITRDKNMLRSHLESTLRALLNNSPKYDENELIENLCFLFKSPLFYFAIRPRLRQAKQSHYETVWRAESLEDHIYKTNGVHPFSKLNVRITWDGQSWATQLLYDESMLLEGREMHAKLEKGFEQSFHWFCDEARCLWYEFKGREHAAAVRLGTALDSTEVGLGAERTKGTANARAKIRREKRKQRIVKLKIRLRDTYAGPVLAEKQRVLKLKVRLRDTLAGPVLAEKGGEEAVWSQTKVLDESTPACKIL